MHNVPLDRTTWCLFDVPLKVPHRKGLQSPESRARFSCVLNVRQQNRFYRGEENVFSFLFVANTSVMLGYVHAPNKALMKELVTPGFKRDENSWIEVLHVCV